jgi:mannose-6-phosphate isomerase-like protein (cupin superfamily)
LEKVNLAQKFGLCKEYWSPKIIGELNESYVKVVKLKGEFVWHHHESEDELFMVVKGQLLIRLLDRDIALHEGEFLTVPRGVEHLPVARDEVQVVLIEPKTTVNTGNLRNERTVSDQWIAVSNDCIFSVWAIGDFVSFLLISFLADLDLYPNYA